MFTMMIMEVKHQDPITELLDAYDNYDACSPWSVSTKSIEQQLIEACLSGNLTEVLSILTHEVSFDWQDEQGETALIVATRAGHQELV